MKVTRIDKAEFAAMWRAGVPTKDIARRLGVTQSGCRAAARRMLLPRRNLPRTYIDNGVVVTTRPWKDSEVNLMREMAADGETLSATARALGRKKTVVSMKANREGIRFCHYMSHSRERVWAAFLTVIKENPGWPLVWVALKIGVRLNYVYKVAKQMLLAGLLVKRVLRKRPYRGQCYGYFPTKEKRCT